MSDSNLMMDLSMFTLDVSFCRKGKSKLTEKHCQILELSQRFATQPCNASASSRSSVRKRTNKGCMLSASKEYRSHFFATASRWCAHPKTHHGAACQWLSRSTKTNTRCALADSNSCKHRVRSSAESLAGNCVKRSAAMVSTILLMKKKMSPLTKQGARLPLQGHFLHCSRSVGEALVQSKL